MVINIYHRGDNKLLDDGRLDEQIISDLEAYIADRKSHQIKHLDANVKNVSHHYDEWTKENQLTIRYAERILKCVRAQAAKPGPGNTNEINDELTKQIIKEYVFADFDIKALYRFVGDDVTDPLDKKLHAEALLSNALRKTVSAFCDKS